MDPQDKIVVLWLTIVAVVVYAIILIVYIIRILKLDKMASNHSLKRPKTLVPKLVLIGFIALVLFMHLLLSFLDKNYYMHPYEMYSLIDIFVMLTLLVQSYIIVAQWRKKAVRSRAVVAQWIIMALFDMATIISVQVLNPTISILLIIFKAIAEIVLVATTVWLDQPNRQGMPQGSPNLLPLMSSISIDRRLADRIYVEFNKEFEITVKNSEPTGVMFKIAVYLGNTSTIISKTEGHFISLQTILAKQFPDDSSIEGFGIEFSRGMSQSTSSTLMRYAEEKQRLCQNFLIEITESPKYYVETLLDFLEIVKNNRGLLLENQQKRLLKKDTMTEEQKSLYAEPFFRVEWQKGKIHVYNEETLQIIVDKPKQEIIRFHQRLLKDQKLKIELLTDDPQPSQLLHFIARVANAKGLWRPFAEWMCLGIKIEDKIYNMFDFWNYGFKRLTISIIGHEIAFDKEGSLHTLYLLAIKKRVSHEQNVLKPGGKTLKKRYNQFVRLDKYIKKFLIQNRIKKTLQDLPPKFSPFGNKTSPKSRQVYFNSYLQELLKIDKINHCVQFLQFLQADEQFPAEMFEPAEESFNDDLIANLTNQSQAIQVE